MQRNLSAQGFDKQQAFNPEFSSWLIDDIRAASGTFPVKNIGKTAPIIDQCDIDDNSHSGSGNVICRKSNSHKSPFSMAAGRPEYL